MFYNIIILFSCCVYKEVWTGYNNNNKTTHKHAQQ